MKIQYHIALLALTISCGDVPKTEKEPEIDTQGAVEIIETTLDTSAKSVTLDFAEVIANIQTKKLPHIEDTNFDSFIEEDDYDKIDVKALKLDQIYPDFNTEGYNYRVIARYKVPVSNNFHTLVTTVLKGDHEMETIMINYDTEGNIIDHEQVAFDEIAESMSRIVSRISENKLVVNKIFWGNIREVEKIEYEIRSDGTIKKTDDIRLNDSFKNFTLINSVLMDLKLDWVQIKTDLITTLEHPDNPNESIVVIPEVVDEGEQYFDLNSHIVIADNRSGKITHNYFESSQTNNWVSDAIELNKIQINATPFKIAENKMAFGLSVSHFGHSRVNPYTNKTLSLFVKSGDSLLKVLADYPVESSGGEWNGDCEGEFVEERKTLVESTEKTNGYFDLRITKEITYSESTKDKNGDCLSTDRSETKTAMLKFNGTTYTQTEIDAVLFSEFHPQKLEGLQLGNFDVNHAFELDNFKYVSGNYQPEDGQIASPDTETDWGDRLLMLDESNKIVYQSEGIGDAYLFEPHFYKSDASNKIIIICQMAFEYPFGGEAFILEKGTIKHLGTLDIEGDGEKYLTEIITIIEWNDSIEFTFKSDKLVLGPGSENVTIANDNVRYVYRNNELILKTKGR